MALNDHVETPYAGGFTLESLGLATQDQVNTDGVLGEQTPLAPDAVINVDMTGSTTGQTSLNDDEIDALPTWNSKINLIKDNSNKIIDMKDIQKDIEGSGTMSDAKADEIHATFENFFTPSNPRAGYTPFDSKTNLQYSKYFMENRLRASMEALVSEFREVKTDSVSELAKSIVATKEFCSEELRDTVNAAVNKISAVRDKLLSGPVMLPFSGDAFINMSTVNLTEVQIDQLKHGVPVSQEFKIAFPRMLEIWKSNTRVRQSIQLMASAAKGEEFTDCCFPDQLHVLTLISAFAEESTSAIYDDVLSSVDAINANLQEHVNELDKVQPETPDVYNLISNQATNILERANDNIKLRKDAFEFGEFAKSATIVILGLASLQ